VHVLVTSIDYGQFQAAPALSFLGISIA
jgi:hypothetical protein